MLVASETTNKSAVKLPLFLGKNSMFTFAVPKGRIFLLEVPNLILKASSSLLTNLISLILKKTLRLMTYSLIRIYQFHMSVCFFLIWDKKLYHYFIYHFVYPTVYMTTVAAQHFLLGN